MRSARALITSGRLPAAKVGRAYLVDPRDLARIFAPVVRTPAGIQRGEGPTAREDGQLARAGIVLPAGGVQRGDSGAMTAKSAGIKIADILEALSPEDRRKAMHIAQTLSASETTAS